MTARRLVAAFALAFALAHAPFLANSLGDIDSVNFALGLRDFNVAEHRPHPPGYPVYIALGKTAAAVTGLVSGGSPSSVEARALAWLSLLSGMAAIALLYLVAANLAGRREAAPALDVTALAAAVVTAACPLFWYLAARPMSDLPGLAVALAAQACLVLAWARQAPGPGGDRRLAPAAMSASGRMIVAGALLAALGIGMRSQTMWYTVPLLVVVLADRIGRGVAGALMGSAMSFTIGGLAWGVPLVVTSGGLGAYLAALGTQAGEDLAAGEMLYLNPNPRAAVAALLRTFVLPWDSPGLGAIVLALAVFGIVQLVVRDRRTLIAVAAMSGPYLVFHLLFHDTSFVRYALPLVPAVGFLAVKGVALAASRAVPAAAGVLATWAIVVATPVLVAYGAGSSPAVRVVAAMQAEAARSRPGALAMHHTFKRPLEAEALDIAPQLPSPPQMEWLELAKYWRAGSVEPLWFLADPVRSDLALIDPQSRLDMTEFTWPLVARPAFGGMRPSSVRWYRMPAPGWFVEEGWALTPETSGMARLMGRGPEVGPIVARVRRRRGGARLMVGGRNLAGAGDPAARFTVAIDGTPIESWDTVPGFFLRVIDVPEGRLVGEGPLARLTIESVAAAGSGVVRTAIEQFDVQDPGITMWAYGDGWHEAEYTPALGVWRWTSERAELRILGAETSRQVTLSIESPLRYFGEAPRVRVRAGGRELATAVLPDARQWTIDVPADALAAASGVLTIETDRTFVPSEQGRPPDQRRLGLRIFSVRVSNALTPREATR